MIKTFRALLADGGQDRIRLSTIKGKVGYKIVKFQLIQEEPGQGSVESTVKIYKIEQTTIDNNVNFTDGDLLGAALYQARDGAFGFVDIVFDNEIFNQDIYVTHEETDGSAACNYYLELEVIPLDDKAAEYTILKNIRTHGTSAI